MQTKKWNYISNLKTLTRDEFGHMWSLENSLNGYLAHLPWWALDQKLNYSCTKWILKENFLYYVLCILSI